MSGPWQSVALDALGVLRARGSDARRFLQGQLSNDMERLSATRAVPAGYHNPQGRVIALLTLLQLADDDLIGLAPRELIAPLLARLGKFVLRAKVRLTDDSAAWRIEGVLGDVGAAAGAAPWALPQPGHVERAGEGYLVASAASAQRLVFVRPASAPALPRAGRTTHTAWQLAAIAAGEPQVYAATSEAFVAQMLNLDVLGAIAFDKGCYTGQEVIARAHYRGRVKRRMQRFVSAGPMTLRPGDSGTLGDGRTFQVVEAAARADARCEFLAVASLSAESASTLPSATAVLEASALPLPYALPE